MKLGLHVGYWGLWMSRPTSSLRRRRPSDSATTRSGPPRPTARTPRRSSPGSPGTTRRSGSAAAVFQIPGRSAGDDRDDRGDDRPALRRADDPRTRQLRPAGLRGLARPAVRPAAAAHARVLRRRADGAARASASSIDGETLELPLPDGPGKALKLTIGPVQERIPIYLAAIGPEQHARSPVRSPTAGCRRSSRPSTSGMFRDAARGGRRARRTVRSTTSTIAPHGQRPHQRRHRGRAQLHATRPGAVRRRDGLAHSRTSTTRWWSSTASSEAADRVQDLYLDGEKEAACRALPDELIDMVSLCGPRERVAERLAAYREAGVGTLIAGPIALDQASARGPARGARRARRLKVFLGAFGQPGHAFPMLALGRAARATRTRGHLRDVVAVAS